MTAAVTAGVSVTCSVHAVEEHVEEQRRCNSQPHQYVSRQVQGDVVRCPRLSQLDEKEESLQFAVMYCELTDDLFQDHDSTLGCRL